MGIASRRDLRSAALGGAWCGTIPTVGPSAPLCWVASALLTDRALTAKAAQLAQRRPWQPREAGQSSAARCTCRRCVSWHTQADRLLSSERLLHRGPGVLLSCLRGHGRVECRAAATGVYGNAAIANFDGSKCYASGMWVLMRPRPMAAMQSWFRECCLQTWGPACGPVLSVKH